jgi:predicted DNA-binding transcriptional regulator AlpA
MGYRPIAPLDLDFCDYAWWNISGPMTTNPKAKKKKFMQLRDVLERFGLSRSTLYKWERSGFIRSVRADTPKGPRTGRRYYPAKQIKQLEKLKLAQEIAKQ